MDELIASSGATTTANETIVSEDVDVNNSTNMKSIDNAANDKVINPDLVAAINDFIKAAGETAKNNESNVNDASIATIVSYSTNEAVANVNDHIVGTKEINKVAGIGDDSVTEIVNEHIAAANNDIIGTTNNNEMKVLPDKNDQSPKDETKMKISSDNAMKTDEDFPIPDGLAASESNPVNISTSSEARKDTGHSLVNPNLRVRDSDGSNTDSEDGLSSEEEFSVLFNSLYDNPGGVRTPFPQYENDFSSSDDENDHQNLDAMDVVDEAINDNANGANEAGNNPAENGNGVPHININGHDLFGDLAFNVFFGGNAGPGSSSSSLDLDDLLDLPPAFNVSPPANQATENDSSSSADSSNPNDNYQENNDNGDGNANGNGNANENGANAVVDEGSNANNTDETAAELLDLMNKPKSKYAYNAVQEIRLREQGLFFNGRTSIRDGTNGFNVRFYGSRQVVERLKLTQTLRKHSGCVNCLNFNHSGELLCSGSDDMRIIVWNWAQSKSKHIFRSGHTGNIFQTKFLNNEGTDIVSSSYDGQVRRSLVPNSGRIQTFCLYKHRGPVHKLVICPGSANEIISVGEDGVVRYKDLRTNNNSKELVRVVGTGLRRERKVRLFSVSHNPYAPQICVCGSDSYIRVYDKRNFRATVHEMCPEHLRDVAIPQVTCCVYSYDGSEVLASYGDDNIYLFNNKVYKQGEYLRRYKGHYNHRTIKGVNFFGPHSEYIVSGSDCGNIFIWDKNTEAILNFMHGDSMGVVNCLEAHPSIPVLATSGLEHHVKIWTPKNTSVPDSSKLEKTVKRNLKRSHEETGEFDDRLFHYFIRRFLRSPDADDGNENNSSSSSSSSEEEFNPGLLGL